MVNKSKTVTLIIMFLILVISFYFNIIFVYIYFQSKDELDKSKEAFQTFKIQSDGTEKSLSSTINEVENLNKMNEANVTEITELKKQLERLHENYENLSKKIEAKDKQISNLKEKLKQPQETTTNVPIPIAPPKEPDVDISEIESLLKNAPMIKVVEKPKATDLEATITYKKPQISIYYESLIYGNTYTYNENQVFYSASLIKAPYILALLQEASKAPKTDQKFDLNRTVVYTKSMYKHGSGKIKNSPEGTVYSYIDLIKYALEYSDNIAYTVLIKEFGYDYLLNLSNKLGVTTVVNKIDTISAVDAGKYMKEIHHFIENDKKYGQLMKDSMLKANHTVMISYGASPSKVAHKYGWDVNAYHDMGIVYEDNPYLLVILTNLDTGGNEVDSYIQKIVKTIDKKNILR